MKNKKINAKLDFFTPIESMNPVYLGNSDDLYERIIKNQGKTFAEIKEDGYRLQVHKKGGRIEGFTRNMNPVNMKQFPEISVEKLPDCILDCEITGASKQGIAGFEEVKRRFRFHIDGGKLENHLKSGITDKHPMNLRVFDVLNWENKFMLNVPLEKRRKITEKIYEKNITSSKLHVFDNSIDLKNKFEELVNENYEGLVCKNPASIYLPGDSKEWIKLKRFETLDTAVLGVYLEKGKIKEFLCGTLGNSGNYETLAKVPAKTKGIGSILQPVLDKYCTKNVPSKVIMNPAVSKDSEDWPTYFVKPEKTAVVEISVMNFSKGKNCYSCNLENGEAYSVRHAVLRRIRDDKSVDKITKSSRIKEFYESER